MSESNATIAMISLIARPEELNYQLACSAYRHTSFSPEQRARTDQQDFASDVNAFYQDMLQLATNDDQKVILEAQIVRYKDGYLRYYCAYLSSHSRVASTMITGPANFPVRQQEKRGAAADRKMAEFNEWRTRARSAIREKILAARTEEEQTAACWVALKREMAFSLAAIERIDAGQHGMTRSAFVNSIVGKVERLAHKGETELVKKAVDFVVAYNDSHKKPAISKTSKFWALFSVAYIKGMELAMDPPQSEILHEVDQIQLIANHAVNRLQIVFPGIPSADIRASLKDAGWHWSRNEGAWQRQLTEHAKISARAILNISAISTDPPLCGCGKPKADGSRYCPDCKEVSAAYGLREE